MKLKDAQSYSMYTKQSIVMHAEHAEKDIELTQQCFSNDCVKRLLRYSDAASGISDMNIVLEVI